MITSLTVRCLVSIIMYNGIKINEIEISVTYCNVMSCYSHGVAEYNHDLSRRHFRMSGGAHVCVTDSPDRQSQRI
jgi:hypothetical protein